MRIILFLGAVLAAATLTAAAAAAPKDVPYPAPAVKDSVPCVGERLKRLPHS